jgi:hypothetical protein
MDLPNGMTDQTCAASRCASFLAGGAATAPALGMIIEADCSTECVATPETDAGEDAGN